MKNVMDDERAMCTGSLTEIDIREEKPHIHKCGMGIPICCSVSKRRSDRLHHTPRNTQRARLTPQAWSNAQQIFWLFPEVCQQTAVYGHSRVIVSQEERVKRRQVTEAREKKGKL